MGILAGAAQAMVELVHVRMSGNFHDTFRGLFRDTFRSLGSKLSEALGGGASRLRSSMFLESPGTFEPGPCLKGVRSKNGRHTGVSDRFLAIKGDMGC